MFLTQLDQLLLGYKCPVTRDIVVQEQDTIGDFARGVFPSKCPSVAPA
jgi:hypothetical protein